MSELKMEFSGSGGKRVVKIDGVSYMMPRSVDVFQQEHNRGLRMQASVGSCEVNGIKCSKRVAVQHVRAVSNKETILALRALREELMPLSGPNSSQVHQVVASLILRSFDLEHPGSGILDSDTVSVRCKRHVYRRQSNFLAGDLRQLDPPAELSLMVDSFLADPAVVSRGLDRAQTASPASACLETVATARGLLSAGVVAPRKNRIKSEGRRAVRGEDGISWALPWGIYLVDLPRGAPGDRLKLRMLVLLSKGSCQVNGKVIGRSVSVRHESAEVSKRSVLALRALRDELFPMDEPARYHVSKEVAAVIMRAFDRENPGSSIQDETVVTLRIDRHGYVKETPYIAGDLRAANLHELTTMTERFFSDPVVMSGTLETGPDLGPYRASDVTAQRQEAKKARVKGGACAAASSAIAATNISRPNVVGNKRGRSEAEGCGIATEDDGDSFPWMWGIRLESEDAVEARTMRLKMKLGVVSVNGEDCVSRNKIMIVRGVAVNAQNMAALREKPCSVTSAVTTATRDQRSEILQGELISSRSRLGSTVVTRKKCLRDEFALGLEASEPVRTIVAAKAFRLWLRSRKASEIPDEERVRLSSAAAVTCVSAGRDVVLTAGVLREAYRERSKVIEDLLNAAARGCSDPLECNPGSPPDGHVVAREEQRGEVGGREGCVAHMEDAGADSAAPTCSSKRTKPKKRKRAGNSPTKSDGPTRPAIKAKDTANRKRGRRKINGGTNPGREGIEGGSPARRVVADVTKSTPDSSAKKIQEEKQEQKERRGACTAGEMMRSATAETKGSKAEGTGESGSKKRAKVAKLQEGIEQDSVAATTSEPETCVQAQQQETFVCSPGKKRKKDRKRDERRAQAEKPRCSVEAEGHVRTGQGIVRATAETGSAERLRFSQTPKRGKSCVEKSKRPIKSRTVRLMDWIANE